MGQCHLAQLHDVQSAGCADPPDYERNSVGQAWVSGCHADLSVLGPGRGCRCTLYEGFRDLEEVRDVICKRLVDRVDIVSE